MPSVPQDGDVAVLKRTMHGGSDALTATRRYGHYRRLLTIVGVDLLVVGAVVGIWAVLSTQISLVPSVGSSISKLVDGVFGRGHPFLSPLWWSLQAILEGFAISAVAAMVLGIAIGRSRFWGAVFDPILTMFYVIPRIILYPVLLGFFGVTVTSEMWMAILSAFFPMIINVIAGVRDVNPTLTRLGASLSCSRVQMARHILFPAAAPAMMVGLRIGWSSSFMIVILAELFEARGGLGQLMIQSYNVLNYSTMFGLVVLVCIIALIGNLLLGIVERRVHVAIG